MIDALEALQERVRIAEAVRDDARAASQRSLEEVRELKAVMYRETQQSISTWAEETFGPSGSDARAVARANREMAELLEHVTSDGHHLEAAEEVADIVIVLYRVATRLGVDLHAEIDRKMAVNRARKWRLDGTGHGYHVKESESAPAVLEAAKIATNAEAAQLRERAENSESAAIVATAEDR